MGREGCVHLPGIQLNLPGRLRTFGFRRLRRMAPALFRLFNITTLQRFTLHSPWHTYPSSTTTLGLQFSHVVPQAPHPAVTSDAGCGRITPNG